MLITLVIIGVVAALTIPTVLKNYNDKKYNTARLKALKTFGEAGKMASINDEINGQPSARAFVENVLSKYLKITKVCDTAEECRFPDKIQPLDFSANKLISDNLKSWNSLGYNVTANNLTDMTNTSLSTYVNTNDGFSAKIFYNSKCVKNQHENPAITPCLNKYCHTYVVDDTCINVIYDMNGKSLPNHVGEDIGFVTVLWSGLDAAATSPGLIPYSENIKVHDEGPKNYYEASELCKSISTNKISYTLANVDELSSIALNQKLSSIYPWGVSYYWSGTPVVNGKNAWGPLYWKVSAGNFRTPEYNVSTYAWCVRR